MQVWMMLFVMCMGSFKGCTGKEMNQEHVVEASECLYKIMPYELWQQSQGKESLELSAMDAEFIHLSTEAQVEKTAAKFFAHVPSYVVVKVDVSKLKGDLVYEANPGGTTKYYHLYNGAIPRSAVVEYKIVTNT